MGIQCFDKGENMNNNRTDEICLVTPPSLIFKPSERYSRVPSKLQVITSVVHTVHEFFLVFFGVCYLEIVSVSMIVLYFDDCFRACVAIDILRPENKWPSFCRWHFPLHPLQWPNLNLTYDFTEVCSEGSNCYAIWKSVNIYRCSYDF